MTALTRSGSEAMFDIDWMWRKEVGSIAVLFERQQARATR